MTERPVTPVTLPLPPLRAFYRDQKVHLPFADRASQSGIAQVLRKAVAVNTVADIAYRLEQKANHGPMK